MGKLVIREIGAGIGTKATLPKDADTTCIGAKSMETDCMRTGNRETDLMGINKIVNNN
jgi:hypothetical protein